MSSPLLPGQPLSSKWQHCDAIELPICRRFRITRPEVAPFSTCHLVNVSPLLDFKKIFSGRFNLNIVSPKAFPKKEDGSRPPCSATSATEITRKEREGQWEL
jgi:hypothetical protein